MSRRRGHTRNATSRRRPPAKRNATRSTRSSPASHARVSVYQLGTVDRIDYTHGRQKRYHIFKRPARLYVTSDNQQIIIAARVRGMEIHG